MICLSSSLLVLAALAGGESSLAADANRALGLRDARIVTPEVVGLVGGPVTAHLDLGPQSLTLQLAPRSVRAQGFRLITIGADGVPLEADPGPSTTLRGEVLELPGTHVAASWTDDGLFARILLPNGEDWWLEPIDQKVAGATPGDHALYSSTDVLDSAGESCGLDQLTGPFTEPQVIQGGPEQANGLQIAELGCDADYEYFLDHGGNTTADIEAIVNTMNLQYEAEVGITHQITTVIVRTSANQPYTSTDAGTLLNQFRSEWNGNQGGVARDVAQLFTGKEINGGTIGIAWVGVVCNLSYAYGVVQSDFNNNFSCATDLSAHELGHNWNAGHCNCTSNTMNPFITCANTFHANFTIPTIESFRDSRNCLDRDGGGGGDPTDVHVASITPGQVKVSKGRKAGRAVVVIQDDLGNNVSGASVTVAFTGDFNESVSGTTGGNGSVTLVTNQLKKGKVNFEVCVTNVTAGLPYDPADNLETCDQK